MPRGIPRDSHQTPWDPARVGAGGKWGEEEGGRALPSPAGVPGRPCCVRIIVSSGEAGKPKAGPAEKPPGWFLGVGAARLNLSSCHVTPRPHTRPGFSGAEEEAPAHPESSRGAPSPNPVPHQRRRPLPRCHTPSLGKKSLLLPVARQAPFCSGRKHLPPLRLHTRNPQPPNCRKPPSFHQLGVKISCGSGIGVKKSPFCT